jgi:hypothetical protein
MVLPQVDRSSHQSASLRIVDARPREENSEGLFRLGCFPSLSRPLQAGPFIDSGLLLTPNS